MFEQLTDVELLEQYRATGDTVYFGELYGRYVHLLLGMARHFIEDRDVALELVVATYEKLQKKVIIQNQDIILPKALLCKILKTSINNYFRTTANQAIIDNDLKNIKEDDFYFMEFGNISPLLNVSELERPELLVQSLKKLPQPQRVCLQLFYTENLSYRQIAVATHYSIADVKSHLQNGKRNLRLLIEAAELDE